MKCQILLSGKNKKKKITSVSSAELAKTMVKINCFISSSRISYAYSK